MCLININPLAVLGVKLARETFYEDFDALIHWETQTRKIPLMSILFVEGVLIELIGLIGRDKYLYTRKGKQKGRSGHTEE